MAQIPISHLKKKKKERKLKKGGEMQMTGERAVLQVTSACQSIFHEFG